MWKEWLGAVGASVIEQRYQVGEVLSRVTAAEVAACYSRRVARCILREEAGGLADWATAHTIPTPTAGR